MKRHAENSAMAFAHIRQSDNKLCDWLIEQPTELSSVDEAEALATLLSQHDTRCQHQPFSLH